MPKSLSECLKPDSVTNNLWIWAERLEKLGKVLFWLIIIIGIIFTIASSITSVEVEHGYYYTWTTTETKFSFDVFITGIIEISLYAFIEYCAYHVLALLISALANITQSTKTVAKISEYLSMKQYPEEICDDVEEQQGVVNEETENTEKNNKESEES